MDSIEKNGIYFVSGIKELAISVGGQFADIKERPIVALLQSNENPDIFWAIPVGDADHREDKQMERIKKFLSYPKDDLRSCYYHIGNTNKKSIFFITDVFPITVAYISRKYLSFGQQHYIIKNKLLLAELDEKLRRILSFEQSKIKKTGKFYFRQNMFGIYDKLISTSVKIEKETPQ